jgi:hypothetical protein
MYLIMPEYVTSENLDWLLDCSYRGEEFDYYAEIDKLKQGSVPRELVVYEMLRQLPNTFLGRNSEYIYDVILYFSDDSVIAHLKNRADKPKRIDEPGYAEDLVRLLTGCSNEYTERNLFMIEINSFHHAVSIEKFLEMHLHDLAFNSRLEVMLIIEKERKLTGCYAYGIPDMMKKIYKENPKAYETFLKSLSDVPEPFTCFMTNTCP